MVLTTSIREIVHYLLGEGCADDAPRQDLHRFLFFRLDAIPAEDMESGMPPCREQGILHRGNDKMETAAVILDHRGHFMVWKTKEPCDSIQAQRVSPSGWHCWQAKPDQI
jgi:hypothetical protein